MAMDDRAPASSRFITAIYEVDGPESRARATAERICFDQTIEAENDLLPPSLQSAILGHLDELRPISAGRYELTVTMTNDLLASWRGPLFGIEGLRKAVEGFGRPLFCGVLKPLGRTPRELAQLVHQFVLAKSLS